MTDSSNPSGANLPGFQLAARMLKNNKNIGILIVVSVLLLLVMLTDTAIIFQMTSQQTKDSGIFQLTGISGEIESTINRAERRTLELALQAQKYLKDERQLAKFIFETKENLNNVDGSYNLYIAGTGWDIIPDLLKPEGFVATERGWYTGAIKKQGEIYVSSPYIDAATGNFCYTVSVMLPDNDTVIGVDYTLENIQAHIAQMNDTGLHNAVIVTSDGTIAGCSNIKSIGKNLFKELPDYAGIFSLAKNRSGVAETRIKSNIFYENLFATKSDIGWYLIVSESDWDLYKISYLQLFTTVILSFILFSIIIILYSSVVKSQKNTEEALTAKETFLKNMTRELQVPLAHIIKSSANDGLENENNYEIVFSHIHSSAQKLSEMINQIISYSSLVQMERKESTKRKEKQDNSSNSLRVVERAINKRFRTFILVLMLLTAIITLYSTVSATSRWGKAQMKNDVNNYEYQLSEWINTQKSILDMFSSIISTHPEMLDDYEGTVDYLNRITVQYPEISVSYMTNPNLEHTVYMNNGWQPDEGWHVEERQWYIDTLNSESGFSISAPYYDEQTGIYCVTLSKRVYSAQTGEFLGNFGIDFYMDKLVDILGNSYSAEGYAFLVDATGDIINHPYGRYQMSLNETSNVSELPYGLIKADGESTIVFKDYDGSMRILIATRNTASNFGVYVVSNIWKIYGKVMGYGLLCLITFFICIYVVYRLLSSLISWQDKANQKMQEATEAALAAGRAKSQFLAQMSHEIRTPINAVLGMNEMILRESKEKDTLDYASNIQTAGRTLLSLINSILDFSKIEDGKMEILSVHYETTQIISGLVNSISARAQAKNLDFIVNVDENLPVTLVGDDVRISQVIMNLLTNAVKYTEKGKVTLTVKETARKDNHIDIMVEVRDTGIGIREEDMGRLFESFERLEEKRNRNIEGTGLGMSIVTRLLAMMNSKLEVESVYGVGSAFSFTLTQEIVDATPIGPYSQSLLGVVHDEKKEMSLYAPRSQILVVDDNETNLKVAKNFMKLFGIVPDLAHSGFEAIEMIGKKNYNMVFLDHMMPKMDGIETLKKMQDEGLIREGCAVIALTANAVVGAKETYLEAGFNDYLSKPIELEKLQSKIIKFLPEELMEDRSASVKAESEKEAPSQDQDKKASADDEVLEFMPEEESSADDEILEFGPEDSEKDGDSFGNTDEIISDLQQNGFDTLAGLRFCAGDKDFYLEMVQDFASSFEEKSVELQSYADSGDFKNYQILIHALKGNAKRIGADALSESARLLEEAAKEQDKIYIQEHHREFLEGFKERAEKINKLTGEN